MNPIGATGAQLSFENQRAGSRSFGWLHGPAQKLLAACGQRLPSRHFDHQRVEFGKGCRNIALLISGSCGNFSVGSYQGRRSVALASTARAISRPTSSPSSGTSLPEVVAEELGTEVKCMNPGIIAFDYNEILRAQEHVVFLDDLLFLHPACHTNALR